MKIHLDKRPRKSFHGLCAFPHQRCGPWNCVSLLKTSTVSPPKWSAASVQHAHLGMVPVVEHTHLSANDLEKQLGYLAPHLAGSRAPNPSPDIKSRLEQFGKHPKAQRRSKYLARLWLCYHYPSRLISVSQMIQLSIIAWLSLMLILHSIIGCYWLLNPIDNGCSDDCLAFINCLTII